MRFLINKNGVYYLTTGTLLEYNSKKAAGHPQKMKDVRRVKAEFKRIRDLPHTWYQAVEVTDCNFSAINTGEEE